MDLPKVVSSNQEALITGPADRVDVGAIGAVGPQACRREGSRIYSLVLRGTLKRADTERRGREPLTEDVEAQSAGVSGPLDVSGGLHTDHLFAY